MAQMSDIRVHLACPHCGATNRLPAARIDEAPVCGRCGQGLLEGQPVALGDADFDAVVGRTALPVLVDFWAPWCGPCVMMAPAFEQAGRALKGRALLVKVNSDDNPQLAARFAIRSIPTLVRLEHGRETVRQSGAVPASAIVALAQG
jgi:thioredoxin 2